ncbi:MAG: hypothetical protein GY749_33310 [Desulfobacteraceae bacterium]|nr:hypothetical protein [Desulfobacteraceae bacterium]MCP4349953.1 hypothetical protein [Desulfobacterales bacterium]
MRCTTFLTSLNRRFGRFHRFRREPVSPLRQSHPNADVCLTADDRKYC